MLPLLAQTSSGSGASGAAVAAGIAAYFAFIGIFIIALTAFYVFLAYMVAKKAGYNPLIALIILIPGANFILLIIFAFSDWPVLRELRELRMRMGIPPAGPAPGGFTPGPGYAAPLPPTPPPPPANPI